jgi:ribosomal-protein-alanine N-acetyltransferase
MTIRPLEPRDIHAIREIDRVAFPPEEQYQSSFYDTILTNTAFNALVAEGGGVIIGWALLDTSVEPARLRSLSVHPSQRRRGYGKRLLNHVLKQCEKIDLLVTPENTAAIALYERCGFSLTTPDPEMPDRMRMVR